MLPLNIPVLPLVIGLVLVVTASAFFINAPSSSIARTSVVSASVENNVKDLISGNKIMVFSKSYCPYCIKAKNALSDLQVPFEVTELDKIGDGGEIQAELHKITGQKTVPNIFVNGRHLGGCDTTLSAIKSGEFTRRLHEK